MKYSIVTYQDVIKDNEGFRFDAEYFQQEYLNMDNLVIGKEFNYLADITNKIDVGHVGPMADEYSDKGIILLQTQNVQELFLDLNECKIINASFHERLRKSQVHYGDILIARSGSFGNASIYLEKEVINSADIILVEADRNKINVFYLATLLNSSIGKNQMYRFASGGLQGHVNLTILERLKVPTLGNDFQKLIEKIVKRAYTFRKDSGATFLEAERIALSEIGLVDWKPSHQLSFIKNFSDSKNADRIDAEYFQPIYDELIGKVTQYRKGYKTLGEYVKIKDKNFIPKDDVTYKYVELANISANGIINGFMKAKGRELPSRARRKVNNGDVIVSSIEGSLSSIALINGDLDNTLCSTGFFVVNSDVINSETLLVLLKSPIGQLQLKKGCSGTILTAINKEGFKGMLLPNISTELQEEIKQKISEMYKAKSDSKKLLDIAKRGVEIAIEQREEEAQNWVSQEVRRHSLTIL